MMRASQWRKEDLSWTQNNKAAVLKHELHKDNQRFTVHQTDGEYRSFAVRLGLKPRRREEGIYDPAHWTTDSDVTLYRFKESRDATEYRWRIEVSPALDHQTIGEPVSASRTVMRTDKAIVCLKLMRDALESHPDKEAKAAFEEALSPGINDFKKRLETEIDAINKRITQLDALSQD